MNDGGKDGGGPAFPEMATTEELHEGGYRTRQHLQVGMTLRDYFAGQALANGWRDVFNKTGGYNEVAQFCYAIADAMLRERAK